MTDPTACAERSQKPLDEPAFDDCTACGHSSHILGLSRCDACRFEIRLREVEIQRRERADASYLSRPPTSGAVHWHGETRPPEYDPERGDTWNGGQPE